MTWKKLAENDCHEWKIKLMTVVPKERDTWRSDVWSLLCMQPARGEDTLMWLMPISFKIPVTILQIVYIVLYRLFPKLKMHLTICISYYTRNPLCGYLGQSEEADEMLQNAAFHQHLTV